MGKVKVGHFSLIADILINVLMKYTSTKHSSVKAVEFNGCHGNHLL